MDNYFMQEKVYMLAGINLHTFWFKQQKDSNKPWAITLHGLRNDTVKMLPIIKMILPYFNVISLDFPGYGKTTEYGDFTDYTDYGALILSELLKKLNLDPSEITILGGSYGANVAIQFLIKNPKLHFKRAGFLAPFFSKDNLSMQPNFRKKLIWICNQAGKGGLFSKVGQWIINNDLIFTSIIKLANKGNTSAEHIAHEKRLWRICSFELWGKSISSLFTLDFSKFKGKILQKNITFIYPRKDQYLDVTACQTNFAKIFPHAIFKTYDSDNHMPKGDFGKNKEFMASIEKIILEGLGK